MKEFFKVLALEIRKVSADSSLFLILLGAPILYAFMYGSIYINKGEGEVNLALVDSDGTQISRTLTDQLRANRSVKMISASDLNDAKEKLNRGEVEGYFYIQSGFEQNILSLKQSNVNLVLNASRFLPSSDLLSSVTQVCLTVGAGVRAQYFSKQGMNNSQTMVMTNPINLNYRPLYNEAVTYGAFLLPGLLAIILQQTLLIGVGATMTSERENLTLHQLYRTSGRNISKIILGKGFLYFFVFMVFAFFFFEVSFKVLEIPLKGGYSSLLTLMALFISTIIVLGLLIGSFFKTKMLIYQVMVFSSYPIFLVTGYSLPYIAFPKPIQLFSDMLPTSPFFKVYLSIVQAGGTLADNLPAIIHLVALWIFYLALLFWRLRHMTRKFDRR